MERAELRRLVEAHALVKRGYENIQQQRNLNLCNWNSIPRKPRRRWRERCSTSLRTA